MNLSNTLHLSTRALPSNYPVCLVHCPDMHIADANDLFCQLIGRKPQHIIRHTFEQLNIICPSYSDAQDIKKQFLVLPTQQLARFMVIPLEDRETIFHLYILMNDTNQPAIPQKTTETFLAQPKNVLANLFYHSPVPAVITLLATHIILEVNQSFLDLIGYPRQDILGQDPLKLGLLPEHRQFEAADRKLKQGKSALPAEQQLRCNHGLLRTVLVSAEPFESIQGTCAISTFVDITEKKHTKEQLVRAIRAALQDTETFSRAVIEQLTRLDVQNPDPQVTELTEREREVLGLIAKGLDNALIAQTLVLSEHTVRNYVTHVYEKLSLHSRAEAIVWARERGLLSETRHPQNALSPAQASPNMPI